MQSTIQYINNEFHCLELINGLFIGQHSSVDSDCSILCCLGDHKFCFKNLMLLLLLLQEMCCKCSLLFATSLNHMKRKKRLYRTKECQRTCANVDCIAAAAISISSQKNLCSVLPRKWQETGYAHSRTEAN